ncbi:DUF300-domain-containing protein [Hymenopellis radicata]|nr:DUF300-domain-containing protein [Hymenopellis radicata]
MGKCPEQPTLSSSEQSLWDSGDWDAFKVEWAISGVCSLITMLITLWSVISHSRHYVVRDEQRQILRILYMPAVFALVSFLTFRHYNGYTYFSLIDAAYEAVTVSAFLLLLVQYVAKSTRSGDIHEALATKEKRKMPLFCCFRYRPTKAYFVHAVKWSVLQFVIIRPLGSLVGIICEAADVFCESEGMDLHYAYVYINIITVISMIFAMYGLLLFFLLVKNEIEERKPLKKFLSVKFIVIVPTLQSLILSFLKSKDIIKATDSLTETEVMNGINAMLICLETVFLSFLMLRAYNISEYKNHNTTVKGFFGAILDSLNPLDFFYEIASSLRFLIKGNRATRGHGHLQNHNRISFSEAFNVDNSHGAAGRREHVDLGHFRSPSSVPLTKPQEV